MTATISFALLVVLALGWVLAPLMAKDDDDADGPSAATDEPGD